jgi:hypothetical protein
VTASRNRRGRKRGWQGQPRQPAPGAPPPQPSWPRRILKFALAAAGAFATWLAISSWWLEQTSPKVDLRWYAVRGDRKDLCEEGATDEPPTLSFDDLYHRRLRLPLQLAFANKDGRRLDDATVVFRFPRGYKVTSSGSESEAADGGGRSYDHALGVLEPTEQFKFLPARDTLYVSVDSLLEAAVQVRGYDQVPEYIESLALDASRTARRHNVDIRFRVELRASHRRPRSFQFQLPGVVVDESWWPPRVGVVTERVSRDHLRIWERCFAGPWDSTRAWTTSTLKKGGRVTLRTSVFGFTRSVQYRVDGVRKRADVDLDGDGLLDLILADTSSVGTPSVALRPVPAFPLRVPFERMTALDPFGLRRPRVPRAW